VSVSSSGGREGTAAVRYPDRPVRAIAVPVKSLGHGKSRLAPVLTPLERGALALAMFEDVLDATLALDGWETWVISSDESVLEIALARRATTLIEDRPSLAGAIEQVEDEASGRGAESLAIVPSDLPLLTAAALTAALHTLGPVVLAPAADERGTNLLLRRPPDAIPSRFGADSYRRHLEAAAERDLPTAVVELDELAFDLDDPDDILTVLEARRPGRTLEVCRELDLSNRVGART
jgi:2-phospho-L-lactate/phosphoenolpyruvate guanylyltransferase